MNTFKVGDRVKCIHRDIKGYGKVGTVVKNGDTSCGVKFDEAIGGHSLDGTCENGYGWWIDSNNLELSTESKSTRPEKPEKPEPQFYIGKPVTYKSDRGVGYRYGGSDQGGFVGLVREVQDYEEDYGCYRIQVTIKEGNYNYTMLESEFEEYNNPTYLTGSSSYLGSSTLTGTISSSTSGIILTQGTTTGAILDTSRDPLDEYKQKPITIKQKPKTKLTII